MKQRDLFATALSIGSRGKNTSICWLSWKWFAETIDITFLNVFHTLVISISNIVHGERRDFDNVVGTILLFRTLRFVFI